VQELRARIEGVRTQLLAGRVTESLPLAAALADEARAVAHPPLVADALFLRGLAEQMAGDFKAAEQTLEDDAAIADTARADHTRAEALVKLVFVVGYGLARRPEGLRWGRLADAAVERVGDRGLEADAAFSLAVTYLEAGDRPKTLEEAERAVRINTEVRGPDNLLTVKSINVLGAAYDSARDFPAAEATYRKAIATYERVLGPHHPYIAAPLGNLGLLYARLGRFEESVSLMKRSNQIERDVYGADHVDVALGSANLAGALRGLGRFDESIAEADASIAIYERRFGADHVDLYLPLLEKGRTLLERGDAAAAIAPLERSLALGKPGEVDPIFLGEARFALGRALVETKRDVPRGLDLAKQARAQFASPDTPEPARVAAVDAWVAAKR
jgi:tetratricopeptide (TPR) repeat protein